MEEAALKMIGSIVAIGVLIALAACNPMAIAIVAMVAYVTWHAAKGLGE